MPYTAIHEGEEKGAFEVPHRTDAYCLECAGRMRVWREAQDGTARHFKHVRNMNGGSSTGGHHNCSGGESDQHQKWKNFAAERASETFENIADVSVEKRFAAPHTDKEYRDADAALIFKHRDVQLGFGLAIEVQHKNLDKDIEATTKDYIKQDIAVAWLSKDDFSENGCKLNEADFRDRARQSINMLPFGRPVPWHLHVETHVEPELEMLRDGLSGNVPAKIPNKHFDEHALEIWRNQDWDSLFTEPQTPKHIVQAIIPRVDSTRKSTVSLPNEYFTWLRRWYWLNTPFEEKLNPPEEYEFHTETEVEASYPNHWDIEHTQFRRLSKSNAKRRCGRCGSRATVYVFGIGFRCGCCGPYPENLTDNYSKAL